jgi:hypothetical protein
MPGNDTLLPGEPEKEAFMLRTLLFAFLAIPALMFAMQPPQGHDPQQPASPSTDAQAQPSYQAQTQQAQTQTAQTQTEGNRRIHDSISDLLSSDPVVNGADVDATVDDHTITLTGTVESYTQHQRVLQLVAQYGRWRKIVDNMKTE